MIQRIVEWNKSRNMDKLKVEDESVMYCLLEEMFEYLGMQDNDCKNLASKYASYIVSEAKAHDCKATSEQKIDALCDINVFVTGFILRNGYSPQLAMEQTLLEIESRQQDPIQKKQWEASNIVGEKWKKDKNQSAETMYKARYEQCLI